MNDTRKWRDEAACLGVDLEVFFPEGRGRPATREDAGAYWAEAIGWCGGCPVRDQCAADALRMEEGLSLLSRYGFQGGLTPEQRHALDPKAPAAPKRRAAKDAQSLRAKLYRSGAADEEIADRTGLTIAQVRQWRGKRRPNTTDEQKHSLWLQGMSDHQIADALGLERTSVQRWRNARGLASNRIPPVDACKRGHPRNPENTRIEGVNRRCRVCERNQKAQKRRAS